MPNQSRKNDKANEFSLISEGKLLELYGWTVRCRLLGELLEGAHRAAPPRDLEAAAVAVCLDLKRGDGVFALGGEFLPAFVRARGLEAAVSALGEPAARMDEAIAAGRAAKRAQSDSLVTVFCTGAAGRSAAWKQALRRAHAEVLPMIFVRVLESAAHASGHAQHGFPAIPADSHDVVAIYRVASESMAHARRGDGATLIECLPWTLAGEDSHDAVLNLERFLAARGMATAATRTAAKAGFARMVRQAASPAKRRQATGRRSRRG